MSDINEARKNLDDLTKKLENQKEYEALKEEEKLNLFMSFLRNKALADPAYNEKEKEYNKTLEKNLKEIIPDLKKMAKLPYGKDSLFLLTDYYMHERLMKGTTLPAEKSKRFDFHKGKWEDYLTETAERNKDYIETRLKFDEYIKNNNFEGFIALGEEIFMRVADENYNRVITGTSDRAEVHEKSEAEKKTEEMLNAFNNSVLNMVKIEPKKTLVDGKETTVIGIDSEGEKRIKAITEIISVRQIDDIVKLDAKGKEIADRLMKENVPEIELLKDEPKTISKMGKVMANYQTSEGMHFGARFQVLHNMNNKLNDLHYNGSKAKMDGQFLGQYGRAYIQDHAREELGKKGLFKENNDAALDSDDLFGIIQRPQNDVKGFRVKEEIVPEGEKYFYKVPELYAKIGKMSNDKLLLNDLNMREEMAREKRMSKQLADKMVRDAKVLLREINTLNPEEKDRAFYKNMHGMLENVTKLGTPDFVVTVIKKDNYEIDYSKNRSEMLSRVSLNQALSNLKTYVNNYKDNMAKREENGEVKDRSCLDFTRKLDDFIWEYKPKVKCIPDTKFYKETEEMKMYNKAKKARGLDKEEVTDKLRTLANEDMFSKEMKKTMADYTASAKLHRCSSEFKKIGKEMDVFRQKYNNMLQIEKEMTDPKKEYVPGSDKKLLMAVKEVKEAMGNVRKANEEYFEHKKKDKEWGTGAKEYSTKRIEAVQGIDYSMQWFESVMDMKEKYVSIDAKRHAVLDAKRDNIKEKLAEENNPILNLIAQETFDTLDFFCKMPRQQGTAPIKEEEMPQLRYDIAVMLLADYGKTKKGYEFVNTCMEKFGPNQDEYKELVWNIANSEEFKNAIDALPEKLSANNVINLITDSSMIHDLRVKYFRNVEEKKKNAEANIDAGKKNANNKDGKNVINGKKEDIKEGKQENNNVPEKNTEPKQKGMGLK